MKKLTAKFGSVIAAMAFMVATVTANSTCVYHLHQDEIPADVKKLSRIK